VSSLIDSKDGRKKVQTALHVQNFYTGAIDGVFGPLTAKAIIAARQHYSLSHPTEPVWDADLERELGLLAIQSPVVVGTAALGGIDLPALFKLVGLINAITKGNLMDGSKPWYTSQTIWASLLSGLATVLAIFHVNFGAAHQATVLQLIEQLRRVGGVIWAIIGRFQATKQIG